MRATSSSLETSAVMPTPPANDGRGVLGALEVGDDDARALRREPFGDRAADPLRRRR